MAITIIGIIIGTMILGAGIHYLVKKKRTKRPERSIRSRPSPGRSCSSFWQDDAQTADCPRAA